MTLHAPQNIFVKLVHMISQKGSNATLTNIPTESSTTRTNSYRHDSS